MGHKLPTERAAYFSNMPDKEMIEAYRKVEGDLNVKASGLVLADEAKLKLEWRLDQLKISRDPADQQLVAEFERMKSELQAQGRTLSVDQALSWISKEVLKRQPTGGLAWTQLNKKDRLSKTLAQLAEVLSEPEDS